MSKPKPNPKDAGKKTDNKTGPQYSKAELEAMKAADNVTDTESEDYKF